MIDYFALALGHGLLAIALLRLAMRGGIESDPLIAALEAETKGNRKASSVTGRNAARRARKAAAATAPDETGDGAGNGGGNEGENGGGTARA